MNFKSDFQLPNMGCGSSICELYKAREQAVNGPCRCFPRSRMDPEDRVALRAKHKELREYVRKLEDEVLRGTEGWDANGSATSE